MTFIVPGQIDGVSVELKELVNAKNGESVPKMAAGMGNTILIPRAWFGNVPTDKIVPYVLAYKHK